MNTDIRISVSFKNHRKRKRLNLLLGDGAAGYLLDLWISTAMNRPSGDLKGMDEVDIALDAGWSGDPIEFLQCAYQLRMARKKQCRRVPHTRLGRASAVCFRRSNAQRKGEACGADKVGQQRGCSEHAGSIRRGCSEHAGSRFEQCPISISRSISRTISRTNTKINNMRRRIQKNLKLPSTTTAYEAFQKFWGNLPSQDQ